MRNKAKYQLVIKGSVLSNSVDFVQFITKEFKDSFHFKFIDTHDLELSIFLHDLEQVKTIYLHFFTVSSVKISNLDR